MEFNREQSVAVEHPDANLLVLAGAGTGKTRTLIGRTAHLLQRGVSPERILLLTFTRRAASEMLSRLKTVVGPAAEQVWAGTFHAFSLRMIRANPAVFPAERNVILDPDDQEQLMKLCRGAFVEKNENFPKASALLKAYSYARNADLPLKIYLEQFTSHDADSIVRIIQICAAYEARKREKGYVDFDDLLALFADELHANAAFRAEVRNHFDHILVDEFQDTNPIQWKILDGMYRPANLFCVGDDAQSIYAFRGADFRNVHEFRERVPDAIVLKLTENYRSGQPILDLANWLLDQSRLDYGKTLKAHRTGHFDLPRLLDFDNHFAEADWIADHIVQSRNEGNDWRHHMVLGRTAYLLRPIEAACAERDIPYQVIGGTSLFQTAHVKDLLCVVRATRSHLDELAWTRYLTMHPGIGDVTASKIVAAMSKHTSIQGAAAAFASTFPKKKHLLQGIQGVAQRWKTPHEALQTAFAYLEPVLETRYDNWDARKIDLRLLIQLAERHKDLMEFMDTYSIDPVHSTALEKKDNNDVVTLITVHSAKGAETRVGYLVGAQPGTYPHVRTIGNEEQEEEDRRVLYVALTRAEDTLILTRSASGSQQTYGHVEGTYHLAGLPDCMIEYENHSRFQPIGAVEPDVGDPSGWLVDF